MIQVLDSELHLLKLKRRTKRLSLCAQPMQLREIQGGRQHNSYGNSSFLLRLPHHYIKLLVVSHSPSGIFLSGLVTLLLYIYCTGCGFKTEPEDPLYNQTEETERQGLEKT